MSIQGKCQKKFLMNLVLFGFIPFWTVDNFENVTELKYDEKHAVGFGDLVDGTDNSDCTLPCLTTKV